MRSDGPKEYSQEISSNAKAAVVTRGPGVVVAAAILTACIIATVELRVYTRLRVQKWFGPDDIFAVLALFATVGYNVVTMVGQARYGWDRHSWDIPMDLISTSIALSPASKLLFSCCASFTRMSFLFFYYRLTKPLDMRRFEMLLYAGMALVVGIFVAAFFCIFLLCSPAKAYWTFPPIPGSKCIKELPVQLTMGSLHTFADLVVTVLPIPLIMKLQMSRSKRVGALSMLSLGFAITAAGCVRIYYSWYASTGDHDLAWDTWFVWVAALAEVNFGLMCCCAPTIRVLITKRVIPALNAGLAKLLSSRGKSNSVSSESSTEKGVSWEDIRLPASTLDGSGPRAC